MKKLLTATLSAVLLATPAMADNHDMQETEHAITYAFEGDFDDATFAVETAIVGKGLVIDYVSHTGAMLERTKGDVGSDVKIYDAADIYLFCSAQISREVMEPDPMNIAFCPYGIFVTDTDGDIHVGYRKYPEGDMQKVQMLLDDIVKEAVSN
ncbi:DUF302 domain-containing protein [Aliiroseovarius sp. F47248L]|uniref:DUF302 domain-containing protein n=1 Tax=Aliiroseovarius sp. F47248L TaxID=2926420 RepID=UPI001FF6DFF2|nr:DUF302 domain-containing protein [Aliiroseovarius sp. F47248L]MCK0138636.1 DUF302 domain-containing protein [Aliiroseovarius sp. F47248L]